MECEATGKVRHVDEAAAEAARQRVPYGYRLRSYPCLLCDGWHLGGHHRRRQGDALATADVGELVAGPGEVWGGVYAPPMGGTTIGERLKK